MDHCGGNHVLLTEQSHCVVCDFFSGRRLDLLLLVLLCLALYPSVPTQPSLSHHHWITQCMLGTTPLLLLSESHHPLTPS